jgi:prevent-host-death family protein
MKTYPINEARAEFSKLVERAPAGEPQRVTRYGKEAVVIASENDWRALCRSAPTLGALLAQHARGGLMSEPMTDWPRKSVLSTRSSSDDISARYRLVSMLDPPIDLKRKGPLARPL